MLLQLQKANDRSNFSYLVRGDLNTGSSVIIPVSKSAYFAQQALNSRNESYCMERISIELSAP